MKNFFCFTILTTTLLASTSAYSINLPSIENRHAVEISIGGIDAADNRSFRTIIGRAIANNVIDKFIVYGYGSEGGFSGCAEDKPADAPPSKAFEKFVNRLSSFHPKPETSYSINRINTCLVLPSAVNKTATVEIAKPDDSISCNLSSGTPLTEMRKELGAITVYSAVKKLPDDSSNMVECGAQTGLYNVYEIAVTNLDQTIALGFTAWPEMTTSPISAKALVQGSQCGIIISGGDQTQNCTTPPPRRR